jgi:uncharacterized iron-regulated membrane protein
VYFRLHAYALLPGKLGRYAIGVAGLLLLVSAGSGLLMHRNTLRAARQVRTGRRLRIVAADMHRALGVWALAFHVGIGATGAALGLKDVLIAPALWARFGGDLVTARAALGVPAPVPSGVPLALPPVEPLLQRARERIPLLEPNLVLVRAWGDAEALITVLGTIPGRLLPRHEAERVTFAARTGEIVEVIDALSAPPALRAYHMVAPLHYADFTGIWLRWIYFVLGLVTAALSVTGLAIRARRHAERASRAAASDAAQAGPRVQPAAAAR